MGIMRLQGNYRLCLMVGVLVFLVWKWIVPLTKQQLHADQPQNPRAMTIEKSVSNIEKHQNKVKHIGFLKVHKAGSTTMESLLYRFGSSHNLTFVLPKSGAYFYKKGGKIDIMAIEPNNHYDILAAHSVYSPELWESVLPPDSIYIGIIREPLDRMISAAFYYRDVIGDDYLKQIPDGLIRNLINFPDQYDRESFSHTRNSMGQDFEFSRNTKINDKQAIEKHLEHVRRRFSLVLVMERFDESLVLMKRLLKWSMSDIIYLKSNTHEHEHVNITDAEQTQFRSTCFLDYVLYDTFLDIFDAKVKVEGVGFQEEVNYFKSILETIKGYCTDRVNLTPLQVHESKWHAKLTVTKTDCTQLKSVGVQSMRDRHHKRHNV